MTSSNEKITFGATIENRPAPLDLTPSKTNSVRDAAPPSPLTTASTPRNEHANPYEGLYSHSPATMHTSASNKPSTPVATHDLESQRDLGLSLTESSGRKCGKENSMWPSLKTQKARAKQQKRDKSCNPLAGMGRRQKLIITAVIALLIIGAAVGIGVGVSKAVGGGVNKVNGGNSPIGQPQKRI